MEWAFIHFENLVGLIHGIVPHWNMEGVEFGYFVYHIVSSQYRLVGVSSDLRKCINNHKGVSSKLHEDVARHANGGYFN